jgi:xanthine dehydrogenase accessory factor
VKSIEELQTLCDALRDAHARNLGCVLVTILSTTGSTFRRVGAAMLVRGDGSVVNALSGGCPQHDLVRRAMETLDMGQLQYVAYNAEHGLDLLLEMGCGGTLEVAVESVDESIAPFIEALESALASREPFRVVTRFPLRDRCEPVVREVVGAGRDSICRASAVCNERTDERVLDEAFVAPTRLVLAGAGGEVADIARAARLLGWRGAIVGSSADRIESLPVPAGWARIVAQPGEIVEAAGIDADTAFLSLTHQVDRDIEYLKAAQGGEAFYLGALGSRERARTINSAVHSPRLHVPAGLDIGSNSAVEIALAVVAEIMACRQQRTGSMLRSLGQPIH